MNAFTCLLRACLGASIRPFISNAPLPFSGWLPFLRDVPITLSALLSFLGVLGPIACDLSRARKFREYRESSPILIFSFRDLCKACDSLNCDLSVETMKKKHFCIKMIYYVPTKFNSIQFGVLQR